MENSKFPKTPVKFILTIKFKSESESNAQVALDSDSDILWQKYVPCKLKISSKKPVFTLV